MSKNEDLSGQQQPVGYRQPPVHSRFQKGKSGNPAGRPKKDKPLAGPTGELAEAILAEGRRFISVQQNGRATRMSMLRAVARAMYLSAAKGNVQAGRHAIKLFGDAKRDEKRGKDAAAHIDFKSVDAVEASRLYQELMRKSWP